MVLSELTASAAALRSLRIGEDPTAKATDSNSPLTNRAGESANPFVRSFESGPVAWQPLSEETVERAKSEGKLLFLHIGFKACHYCRLMSIESFANAECAAVLNDAFIPVLIDRESRPDLDTIYMNYVQAVNGVGGWPLNVFVTPELEPIFGGTYWPGPNAARRANDENAEDALDFLTIVKKVRDIWKEQEARCRKEATEVLAQLREFAAEGTLGTKPIVQTQTFAPSGWAAPVPSEPSQGADKTAAVSSELDLDQLEEAYTHIAGTFDPVYGGFGLAPKFLTPPKLQFLLGLGDSPTAVQDIVGEAECTHAIDMAVDTLRKIRDGALHDHIGATGFARCSVTPDWTIPNFEKLVVDNAQLLPLYLTAWRRAGGQATSEFYNLVLELAAYLTSTPILRADGLLASSEAADSYVRKGDREMKEGAFYLWTRREFDSVIEAAEKGASQVVAAHWGIVEGGNVDEQHDPNDDFMNQNILRVAKTPEELSKQFNTTAEQIEQSVRTAQKELKARREGERVRPEVDDKAVAGWNGLALSALAKTAEALKIINPEVSAKCASTASGIAFFLQKNLWDVQAKILYRVWTGARDTEGFADDYAYVIQGLLDLFETNRDETLLEFADALQKAQSSHFYDPVGGFFTTTANSTTAILRLKDGMDTSLPSTNAVSVANLYRLGQLLDDETFAGMARSSINAFEAEMLQHPWLFPGLLGGVDYPLI
ncbi:hypothetical protein LLEC1_01239 [Akanthomyces lecanii]|uniref:Spermatogenesis-associated protein 20-like TRX domain-containing protein n=1 Tax=Cordyceps confragosa TaxID=2714763 RepID=A0A179ICH4_CORDF|nr:hypothetical protein LLEC1_01239 [Akanthomyces lecanii]